MVMFHSNPDVEQAIDQLSSSVQKIISKGSAKMKILKKDVTKQVSILFNIK